MQQKQLSAVLAELHIECETFARRGLASIDPDTALRLASGQQFVCVRLQPSLRIRLVVPAGVAYEENDVTDALGQACAEFAEQAMHSMGPAAAALVKQLLDAGQTLGVMHSNDGSTLLVIDDGVADPRVLVTTTDGDTGAVVH